MTSCNTSVARLTNLLFQRDSGWTLGPITLTINKGQWLVLRGPNGVGKSTLLHLLVGLLFPEEGSRWINPSIPLSFLGHRNGNLSHLKVQEALALKAALLESPVCCQHILQEMHLISLASTYIKALSAGQQRRVGLASLLLCPGGLWVMDEPFDHLDEETLTLMLTLCEKHVRSGGAIFQTAHGPVPSSFPMETLTLETLMAEGVT